MTASDAGKVDVQHLCKLAGVSRASYYRRFEARAPREADVELTSHIQLLCLRYRFYGYRRITAVLRRSGLVVNAKRVQRLMREDNLIAMRRKPFAPPTSDSRDFVYIPGRTMDELEMQIIERTLERADGNKTRAAELLAIGVRTIFRKLGEKEEK